MSLLSRASLGAISRYRLPVFLFHKVPSRHDALVPNELLLSEFESLLDFVEEHFKVIPLGDAVSALRSGRFPRHCACITFDDGYPEWIAGVVPLLKRRNMHATFFITTGQFAGVPMWHERVANAIRHCRTEALAFRHSGLPELPLGSDVERSATIQRVERFLKYLPLDEREQLLQSLESMCGVDANSTPCMPAEDVRAIHSQGFDIGAHTRLHPILSLCDRQSALAEIGAVRENLGTMIGGRVNAFAYPNGRPNTDFSREHVDLVKTAGYEYAVTTGWGGADISTPIYQIPRFTPWGPTHRRMTVQVARNLVQPPRLLREKTPARSGPSRVLFVENGAGFGGAVVALDALMKHWPHGDFEPHVVSNLPSETLQNAPNVASYRMISDHRYDFKPLVRRIQDAKLGPLKTASLFMLGRMDDLVNHLPYFLHLLNHARRLKPDLIHGNNEPASNRIAMLVASLLNIPYVQHLRGPLAASRVSTWLMSRPNVFIPVSRWLAGALQSSGVSPERVRQVYDGIELPAETPRKSTGLREELGLPADAILVAMVGMLVQWKGQDLFIDAIDGIACKTSRPLHFLLIGGTPERGDRSYAQGLDERASALATRGQIHFLGQRDDLRSFMGELDVVVSASTEPEPLGLVMLEALASNCVFVAPAFGAAVEVIDDARNGFLFTPRSAASLREKIEMAVNAAEARTLDRKAGAVEIRQRFSGQRCADTTLMIYRSLI